MKKIFVAAFVSILLLAGAVIALPGSAKAATSGDYSYTTDISGNATITGYTGTGGNITIPSTLGGYTVTAIGGTVGSTVYSPFKNKLSITGVTVPDSVTTIGAGAFSGCSGLLSITLGNHLESIGASAFLKCSGLTSLEIPSTVTDIGTSAFSNCSGLTSLVIIPSTVTSLNLGQSAFSNCTGLTSLVLPTNITSIPKLAFNNCSGLTSLVIPDSVTSIGVQAFSFCTKISEISIGSGVTSIDQTAFSNLTSLTQYKVSADNPVFSSDGGVLFDNGKTALISCPIAKTGDYTVPESVMSIANSGFYNCKLSSITLGSGIKSIGNNAFEFCTLSSITIPDSVTSIGDYAFRNCRGLINATLGSGISSIGPYTFYNCIALTEITIPGNIQSIGSYAFGYCGSLNGLSLPDSVTSIGSGAFASCSGFTGFTIPDSVTSIGSCAFQNCNNITHIDVGSGNANYASLNGVLFDKAMSTILYYPAGKTGESFWIPDGVTTIDDEAFRSSMLSSVRIPASVFKIGNNAFYGCGSLASAYFYGNAPAYFGGNVFYNCAPDFTVYYLRDKTGFSMPVWNRYAATDALSCDVLFDSQGGSNIGGFCVFPGTMINEPEEPVKTAYIFVGWYKDTEYTDEWMFGAGKAAALTADAAGVSAADTVTGDTMLFAKWEPKPCIITAVSNNTSYGTAAGGGTYKAGDSVTLTATSEPGYLFYSWTDESGAAVSADAVYTFTPMEDRTFTAVFGTVAAPAEIKAISTGGDTIEVSWSASAGAEGYMVYMSTSLDGEYKKIAAPAMTSYTDTKLTAGITYYYKVCAFKYSGDTRIPGSFSETVSATPELTQVTGLKAASAGITKIELVWDTAPGSKGYEIWRSESQYSGYVCIDSTEKTYYTDKGLVLNKMYYYQVRAYVKHGNTRSYGDFSNAAAGMPALGTVTELAASADSAGSIKISWDAVPGSSGYKILRSTSPNGEYTVIGVTAQGSAGHINYRDKNCSQNTTYYYKIRAYIIIDKVLIYGADSAAVSAAPGGKGK